MVNDFASVVFARSAVARAQGNGAWQFIGGAPVLFDPPRIDAKATIATAARWACTSRWSPATPSSHRRGDCQDPRHGLGHPRRRHASRRQEQGDPESTKTIESADGYAQVFPEDKFHIVDVLERHGHIVGMTGDGVNDAPALKKADCGIAVSSATDAARAAASIVLTTPNTR